MGRGALAAFQFTFVVAAETVTGAQLEGKEAEKVFSKYSISPLLGMSHNRGLFKKLPSYWDSVEAIYVMVWRGG